MKLIINIVLASITIIACNRESKQPTQQKVDVPSVVILGNVQDAGSPHIGCTRACCKVLFKNPDPDRMVVSIGIVDPANEKTWLIEATPDITRQLKLLGEKATFESQPTTNGIFLTHAHIGHYTGLMYLGREALGSAKTAVYTMPKMHQFLTKNGPWSQLVNLKNITLQELKADSAITLSSNFKIQPFTVPHRDEFSETVGYKIIGPAKSVLFIPDINKWNTWEKDIIDEIKQVDYALLDAAFYDAAEIGYRDISEIPHPFVIESLGLFESLPASEKAKVHFIHLNHTNPLLNPASEQSLHVIDLGFKIARTHDVFVL